jgi:hypothetical protein
VVLLLDPPPAAVLTALDAALDRAQGEGLVVFYYSGHADTQSLFPHGEPLALSELKARLTSEKADIRVGIIDGCRGGGWTQAKGLAPAEPFAIGLQPIGTEGTVLLASSSGLEDAHEAESLQGSFFTHHLVAGLRGAADQSGDGKVTLGEAFGYANALTVRDTALVARVPQHPSFDMKLHGRQDVVLTALADSPSTLSVSQQRGPLQVLQLGTGLLVAESNPGAGTLTLAVPAGEYLVRRVDENGVVSKKVIVASSSTASVDEDGLTLTAADALVSKGVGAKLPPLFEVSSGVNVLPLDATARGLAFDAAMTWRVNGWLSWRIARLAYQANFQTTAAPLTGPYTQLMGGSDVVFTVFRSDPWPAGFRFELAAVLGPTFAMMTNSSDGIGGSAEAFVDFRLPYLPDVHLRVQAAEDVLWNTYTRSTLGNLRVGTSIAWRFGQ